MKQKKVSDSINPKKYNSYKKEVRKCYESKTKATFKKLVNKLGVPAAVVDHWIKTEGWIPKQAAVVKTEEDARKQVVYDSFEKLKTKYALCDEDFRVCMHFIAKPNWVHAVKKVIGSDATYKDAIGIRTKPNVRAFLKEAQEELIEETYINASLLIEELLAIAHSDMADVADFKGGLLSVHPSNSVDTRMIKKISQKGENISIELYNKMDAINNLMKYQNRIKSHEQRYKDDTLQLARDKFEFEKSMEEGGGIEAPDDGFLDALNKASRGVFDDEESEYGDNIGVEEDEDEEGEGEE